MADNRVKKRPRPARALAFVAGPALSVVMIAIGTVGVLRAVDMIYRPAALLLVSGLLVAYGLLRDFEDGP